MLNSFKTLCPRNGWICYFVFPNDLIMIEIVSNETIDLRFCYLFLKKTIVPRLWRGVSQSRGTMNRSDMTYPTVFISVNFIL